MAAMESLMAGCVVGVGYGMFAGNSIITNKEITSFYFGSIRYSDSNDFKDC